MFFVLIALLVVVCGCKQKNAHTPKGIVVLSPEVAEIICALDAGSEIVGITAECDYPPSLAGKHRVGSFSSINREAILALNPKLIFCSALEQEGFAAELGKLGYQVEIVYPTSLHSLLTEIQRIGDLIGRQKEAENLVAKLNSEIETIKTTALDLASRHPKPKVYIEIYRNPLMSVSDSSFVGELIETAGGDNVFSTLERDYARVNPEAVIKAKPDIMICYSQDSLQAILSRKGWQNIPAIKNRRIIFEKDINPDLLQRATPRAVSGMRLLQEHYTKWQNESL